MSARAAVRKDARSTYFASVPPARHAVDLGALSVLFVLALLGFSTVYGTPQYLITGFIGLVLGTGIALIGARWRWGLLRIVPLLIAVYFLLGTVLAAPTHARWLVVPTLASLLELLRAPVTAWKALLTLTPPVGAAQGVLAVVWISTLVLCTIGASVVLRTRWAAAAWAFPFLLMLVSIAFGTTEAPSPVVRGTLFAVVSIAWMTWRFESARIASSRSTIIADGSTEGAGSLGNPVLRRRIIGGAVVLALSAGAAVSAQSLLVPPDGTGRFALRDRIAPPFDPEEQVSPLTEFRGYLKHQEDDTLFTVTGVSGGEQIRIATLDRYDANVYNVADDTNANSSSGAFLRTAQGVDLQQPTPDSRRATVTVDAYSGVWMPTLGEQTQRIDIDPAAGPGNGAISENLFLNQQAQTAVASSGLQRGDVYDLTYEPYTAPTAEQQRTAVFSDIDLPDLPPLDPMVEQFADEWAGDNPSDVERFRHLMRGIKKDAHYTNGLDEDAVDSMPGHSARRLTDMLQDPGFDDSSNDTAPTGKIGDEEQFAALTAVMARSLGIPARVGFGFVVPEDESGEVPITGADVTAWVEVSFEGLGWVRFDAHPDTDDEPIAEEPKVIEKPRPQVRQPPPPPAEPPRPPPGATSEDPDQLDDPDDGVPTWLVYTGIGLFPLLLVAAFAVTVIAVKSRRRGHRRLLGTAAARIDGGWQEVLDLLSDRGTPADPLLTRSELAARFDADAAAPSGERSLLPGLAAHADRAAFGPDDLPPAAAEQYWDDVDRARAAMTAALPWHRRLRMALSLRSLRRQGVERRREARRERAALRTRRQAERRQAALLRPARTLLRRKSRGR